MGAASLRRLLEATNGSRGRLRGGSRVGGCPGGYGYGGNGQKGAGAGALGVRGGAHVGQK